MKTNYFKCTNEIIFLKIFVDFKAHNSASTFAAPVLNKYFKIPSPIRLYSAPVGVWKWLKTAISSSINCFNRALNLLHSPLDLFQTKAKNNDKIIAFTDNISRQAKNTIPFRSNNINLLPLHPLAPFNWALNARKSYLSP